MGRLRKRHNWKGRQQSESEQSAAAAAGKTDVLVELEGTEGDESVDSGHISVLVL